MNIALNESGVKWKREARPANVSLRALREEARWLALASLETVRKERPELNHMTERELEVRAVQCLTGVDPTRVCSSSTRAEQYEHALPRRAPSNTSTRSLGARRSTPRLRYMGAVPQSAPLALLGTELSARGSADDLQIRLLPHRLFARQCADERPADAVVLHCYAEKVLARCGHQPLNSWTRRMFSVSPRRRNAEALKLSHRSPRIRCSR